MIVNIAVQKTVTPTHVGMGCRKGSQSVCRQNYIPTKGVTSVVARLSYGTVTREYGEKSVHL